MAGLLDFLGGSTPPPQEPQQHNPLSSFLLSLGLGASAPTPFSQNIEGALQKQQQGAEQFAATPWGQGLGILSQAMSAMPAGRMPIPRSGVPMFAAEMGGAAKPAFGVMDYVSELKKVAGDDALVTQLKSDKSITQPQMREIAQQFIGWEFASSKPRGKALQHIIDRQMLDARQAARMGQIDKTNNSW